MQLRGMLSRRVGRILLVPSTFSCILRFVCRIGSTCRALFASHWAPCRPGVTNREMERPRGPQLGEMGEVGYNPPIFPATPTSPMGYNPMLSGSGAAGGFVMNPLTPAFVPEAQRLQHQCVRGHPPEQRMLMATCPSNIPSSMQAPLTAQFGYPWPQSAPQSAPTHRLQPQQPWMAQPQPQPVPVQQAVQQPVQPQSRTVAAATKEMTLEEKKLHASQVRQSQGRDLNQASQQGLKAVDEMLSAAFKRATPVLAKLPPGVVPVEAPEKSPLPFVELDRGLLQQLEEADRVVQAAAAKKTEILRKEREVPSEVAWTPKLAVARGTAAVQGAKGSKGKGKSKGKEGNGPGKGKGKGKTWQDYGGKVWKVKEVFTEAPPLGQEGAVHRWLLRRLTARESLGLWLRESWFGLGLGPSSNFSRPSGELARWRGHGRKQEITLCVARGLQPRRGGAASCLTAAPGVGAWTNIISITRPTAGHSHYKKILPEHHQPGMRRASSASAGTGSSIINMAPEHHQRHPTAPEYSNISRRAHGGERHGRLMLMMPMVAGVGTKSWAADAHDTYGAGDLDKAISSWSEGIGLQLARLDSFRVSYASVGLGDP
ncbi:unnamed protein product [Symbiodinium sp. KB8]|nr:unnamed protein product [Symbiodinium sp. KB8]